MAAGKTRDFGKPCVETAREGLHKSAFWIAQTLNADEKKALPPPVSN